MLRSLSKKKASLQPLNMLVLLDGHILFLNNHPSSLGDRSHPHDQSKRLTLVEYWHVKRCSTTTYLQSLSPDLDLNLYMHISINNFILNNQLQKMLHSNVSIKSERFDAVYWKLWWNFPFVYSSDFWIFVHTILRNMSDMVFLNSKMLFPEKSYRHFNMIMLGIHVVERKCVKTIRIYGVNSFIYRNIVKSHILNKKLLNLQSPIYFVKFRPS